MTNNTEILEIANIIARKIQGDISPEDTLLLESWLDESSENRTLFQKMNHEEYSAVMIENLNTYNTQAAKINVFTSLRRRKRRSKYLLVAKYAAVILFPLFLVLVMKFNNQNYFYKQVAHKSESPQVLLLLSDGTSLDLHKNDSKSISKNSGSLISNSNNQLIYSNSEKSIDKSATESTLVYNSILTSDKGTYMVQLDDGTKVWLNENSKLRYPIEFNGKERNVYLEGEAYLEVAHNKEKPFIVNLKSSMTIQVLGTSFNINSSKTTHDIQTTLVEGSVKICKANSEIVILKPGYQADFDIESDKLNVTKVRTELFVAWKDGDYLFKDKRLEDVMHEVSKRFDVKVLFNGQGVRDLRFSGSFNKANDLSSILEMFESINKINISRKKGNIVISKK